MTAPFSAPHFAISLYCSDFRNPAPQVEYLNTVADSYHVDIMDGHFSPSMGLCTSWIEQMLPLSTLRNEVHMMVTDPDHWIDQLVVAGATMLTPHVESLGAHAFRTLRIIHENGCGAGVAPPYLPGDRPQTPALRRLGGAALLRFQRLVFLLVLLPLMLCNTVHQQPEQCIIILLIQHFLLCHADTSSNPSTLIELLKRQNATVFLNFFQKYFLPWKHYCQDAIFLL